MNCDLMRIVAGFEKNYLLTKRGVTSASYSQTGFSVLEQSGKKSEFFSSNDFALMPSKYSPSFSPFNKLRNVAEAEEHLRLDQISSNIYYELEDCLGRLGKVKNLEVTILEKKETELIWNKDLEKHKTIKSAYYRFSLRATIECYAGVLSFNEEGVLDPFNPKKNIFSRVQELEKKYINFVKTPFREIDDTCLDLILPKGLGGILIHEAIGHPLEADYFLSSSSFIREQIGKKIASTEVTVVDSPLSEKNQLISDDGSTEKTIVLINSGVLSGVMADRFTSSYSGLKNTGNGRSCSFSERVIPRMRYTYLQRGAYPSKLLTFGMKNGIVASELGGGQVDSLSGDFSFVLNNSYFVQNGIPIALCSPLRFSGNTLEVLGKIKKVGNDFEKRYAICSKKGQSLPVAFGSPTFLLEKVRVSAL